MRDGATAQDLWVSFDKRTGGAYTGAYEDYSVNAAGDITITADDSYAMTVRVWNGKGIKGADGKDGKDGKDGVNGTVQWGVNGPSKVSTLEWTEI